jgi:3-oxoacyl-[acyl-carrier-protein] synthase-3
MVMSTEAETLLVNGCRLAAETWSEFKDALGWRQEEINPSYCHQVGQAHRDRFLESIGLDPAIDFSTFPFLGNVGSVSLPLTMAMGVERDPPAEGNRLALLGIGSGLCCAMLGVVW